MITVYQRDRFLETRIEEPECFAQVRQQTISLLLKAEDDAIVRWAVRTDRPIDELHDELDQIRQQLKTVATQPNWMKPRPPRRMPRAESIARYWELRSETFSVDASDPRCFACKTQVEKWSDLDRAHIEDRFLGGLDHEANLAMICQPCHRLMPMFEPGTYQDSVGWILSDPRSKCYEQVISQVMETSGYFAPSEGAT
jgi:hypothetical protein